MEGDFSADLDSSVLESKRQVHLPDAQVFKSPRITDILEEINPNDYLSRIQVHNVDSVETFLHEVVVPPDVEYKPLRPCTGIPAKEYEFPLDPFQKEAILCLENNQSVLVSAHTSAGKTVVTEYAIALSLRENQRVIYTTPIKALSNKKYREFFKEFKDVGLMTGDVTINPSASCLIMTPEILRNMLYKEAKVIQEVGWVVYDDIHDLKDESRGVICEETFILLPDFVHCVFLSPLIPNAIQFAKWICYLHNRPCHVVYTEYRPVPLKQYLLPTGSVALHLIVDENGNFNEEHFNSAMKYLQRKQSSTGGCIRKKSFFIDYSECRRIVVKLMKFDLAPIIIFSCSRKECETYAMNLAVLDLNCDEEKNVVEKVFKNAMNVLSDEDQKLPQFLNALPILKRGIGIHHGGLLPVLKETTEILLSKGVIKILFATETFAMGLNVCAKTVLFINAQKYDGRDFRWITSGEYMQMSNRAGRRSIDNCGSVVLLVDTYMSPLVVKEIVKGLPDSINSAFHLTYNMVLNSLRVSELNPEDLLERSFFQFQKCSDLYEKLKNLCGDFNALEGDDNSTFKARLEVYPQYSIPENDSRSSLLYRKSAIAEEIERVKDELKKAKSLLQMDELTKKKSVLTKLGFCSASDIIENKGRVACEISNADELLLTEMIFNGVFKKLNIHQTLALLSCFVFEDKFSNMPKLTEELAGPLHIMQETAKRIAKISKEAKLELDIEQYVASFKPHLMDVVHSWSKGVTFNQICKMTDVFEGRIVRHMRRLEELMRQMCQVAKAFGDDEMENKFSEGIGLIKRDVIFAESLYL